MESFTDVFREATRRVGAEYFHVAIHGGDAIYRERVYCYELYHQMRCVWPEDTDFYLNGELDKAAHPFLSQLGFKREKPDFLVHKSGTMEHNYAVIEVKTCEARNADIREDLEKLTLFVRNAGYRRAVSLFYGYGINDMLLDRVRREASGVSELANIEVWTHSHPGENAQIAFSTGE